MPTLEELEAVARGAAPPPPLDDGDRARIAAARGVVEDALRSGRTVYGVNTGFGDLVTVSIAAEDTAQLQLNLIRSHAVGSGEPLSDEIVRGMVLLLSSSLRRGRSGVRQEVVELLLALLERGVTPVVPSRGSVGSSGDLAPLAHLALVLIGEGEALDNDDGEHTGRNGREANTGTEEHALRFSRAWRSVSGAEALSRAGLTPIRLGPKEGLALINGTQPSTAMLALALAGAEQTARAADIAAALSIDALRGSIHPFDPRIHAARPFAGQRISAANIERLVSAEGGSAVNRSHRGCGRVQDAYSMRCAAQVHGATRDALRFARDTVAIEANSATDNPMVFADSGEIVSGGNFHGAPVAIAADLVAAAIVPLATISERRTDRLVDPTLSGLPPFLTEHGGLRSGLMMAQVTAAAVASELKTLAYPAGADTIPTSANKEDHVSMSMGAALKAERAVARAREVVAVELLCACQAIDLLAPLTTSPPLARVHALVRSRVPRLDDDRPPSPDITAIAELIDAAALERACGELVK